MTRKNYFLGIDCGTQSMKTIVVNGETGKVIGKATKDYGFIDGLPLGYKEQDPAVWIGSLHITVNEAIKKAKINSEQIQAMGVSGQQHGFVPLDREGNVIRPAKLWNDTSTVEECEILTEKLGGEKAVIEKLGLTIPPGFTASKILWLKRHEPANYEQLHTILLPHDYLNFYLTGRRTMEYGDGSGTALMNIRTRTWCREILKVIDPTLEEKLPGLQSSDKPAGTVRKEVAEKLGLPDDVLVSAGGGDNMMGAIGTGNTQRGIVTASFGTSGTIYAYSDTPVSDPKGEIAAFCDSTNAWLPLLCTMNVTVATELVRTLFGMSHEELSEVVKKTPPGSDGLILIPYFEGERTPNIPDGTGIFYGLNSRTFGKGHFARASMEGVTLGMNYGLNRMRALGVKPRQIRLTGGGSKSLEWRQIAADIFNVEVACLEIDEGAAYGAALQAMWTYRSQIGEKTSIQEITERYVKVDEKTKESPKHTNVELYRELQKLQDGVSRTIRKTFSQHRKYLRRFIA